MRFDASSWAAAPLFRFRHLIANTFPGRRKLSALQGTESESAIPELEEVETALLELNQTSEADFLEIGAMLTDLMSSVRQISSDAAALAGAISGQQGEAACNVLNSALQDAREMQRAAELTSCNLSNLHTSVSTVRRGFSAFSQTASSFRVVATLARIETERLGTGNSDIGHLAEEFRSQTETVASRVARMIEDAAAFEKRITATLQNQSELQRRELSALPALISGVEEHLSAFQARQREAAEASANLVKQFEMLSTAISDIVSSIQSHDITRQQIEHVVEVLQGYKQKPAASGAARSPDRSTIRLQRAQLDSARKAFLGSVSEIDGKLDVVARQTIDMAATSRNLLGLDTEEQHSFFTEMEGHFNSILETMSKCSVLEKDFEDGTVVLRETLDRLAISGAEVRSMALQIKWLAMNTGIKAIHIGAPGEPLNIVADSMLSLGSDCERNCDRTESGLDAMNAALRSVCETGIASRRRKLTVDEVRTTIGQLKSFTVQSLSQTREVAARADALRSSISAARDRFSVGSVMSETVSRCCELLDAAVEKAPDSAGQEDVNSLANFSQIAERYTMHSEREVHRDITGMNDFAGPEEVPVPAMSDDGQSEFGENVELF